MTVDGGFGYTSRFGDFLGTHLVTNHVADDGFGGSHRVVGKRQLVNEWRGDFLEVGFEHLHVFSLG